MMTLISLAITVAFVFSWVVELGLIEAEALWWELATLVTIMLLGHWIEMRSIHEAQGALQALAKLLPDTARRITDAGEEEVASRTCGRATWCWSGPARACRWTAWSARAERPERVHDHGRVAAGEEGRGRRGDRRDHQRRGLAAGGGDGHGRRDQAVGDHAAGRRRPAVQVPGQHLADRAAQLLTAVAMSAGVITLVVWQLIGAPIDFSIVRTVTVLVIACPHALGLAVPLVVAISTTMGAQSGLLVRDRRGLEEARNLDVVIFDKTGTLTLGEHRVVDLAVADGTWTRGGAPDRRGRRVRVRAPHRPGHRQASAEERGSTSRRRWLPGHHRARAWPRGRRHRVPHGRPGAAEGRGRPGPGWAAAGSRAGGRAGPGGHLPAPRRRPWPVFAVADAIREESRAAVDALHERGLEVAMLTGDAQAVADAVAEELGIDTVFAEVLPEDKASKVRELQAQGKRVAMVGDGVNDAPALATADIGIAIGAGTDVAVEAGHIVLVRSDPRDIPRIVSLSRATYRKMVQNLWWAAGYNIVAIPLAAGVLAAWGMLLTPAVGAVFMSASTVIVAINAQLLKPGPYTRRTKAPTR
jgi:P-type Cu2+ transporter